MAFLVRSVRVTTGAMLLLGGCSIYTPDLLTSTDGNTGGMGGAAGAGNTCGTGSKCKDAGPDGSSGPGGAAGSGGAAGAGGAGGAVIPDDAPSEPYITSTTTSPNVVIGLSSEGALDWAHWGLKMATDYNHKVNVAPLISLATATAKPRSLYIAGTTPSPSFVWSDGTPTVTGNSSNGIQIAGATAGDGFVVTVPASADLRGLHLYLGVFDGTGEITMTLTSPGGDGALNVDASNVDSLTSASETWNVQVVTVKFLDANPKSTLSVSWLMKGVSPSIKTAIHLAAAALQLAQQ